MDTYYIETSKGMIFFNSSDINNMKIMNDNYFNTDLRYQYIHCLSTNDELPIIIDKLTCAWDKMSVVQTENGLFLVIDDFDSSGTHYIEYKIYYYKEQN